MSPLAEVKWVYCVAVCKLRSWLDPCCSVKSEPLMITPSWDLTLNLQGLRHWFSLLIFLDFFNVGKAKKVKKTLVILFYLYIFFRVFTFTCYFIWTLELCALSILFAWVRGLPYKGFHLVSILLEENPQWLGMSCLVWDSVYIATLRCRGSQDLEDF